MLHNTITSTKAVLYFGTPHTGTEWASLHRIVLNICGAFTVTNTRVVQHLERDSEYLYKLQAQYDTISFMFKTVSFYEEYPTNLALGRAAVVRPSFTFYGAHIYILTWQLVGPNSAVLRGQPTAEAVMLHKNHVDMAKFSAYTDVDFRVVISYLRSAVDDVRFAKAKVEEVESQSAFICHPPSSWISQIDVFQR